MSWVNAKEFTPVGSIQAWSHELDTDYVNPVTGLALATELKTLYFMQRRQDHQAGWIANKCIDLLEPEKFTLKDWSAIAQVADKPKSWVYKQLETHEK